MSRSSEYLSHMEHGVLAVVGSGKQGKSCSLHSLLALWQPGRPVCMLDPLDFDISIFPDHYSRVGSVSEIPVGAVCVIEDVNRVFHSRGSSMDATLQKWLGIISHKSNIVAFTTQSLAGTDLEFLRSQDTIIINKKMHAEDLDFERPEYRVSQSLANYWIETAASLDPVPDIRSWCFFPRFNEVVSIPIVSWWDDRHSKMFREVNICP